MRPGAWWPIAVVAVLGVTVAANVCLLIAAGDPNAATVEPDYYRKALDWDSSRAEQTRSDQLGWRAEAAIDPLDPAGEATVRVRLIDGEGGPVRGAVVNVTALHNRDASRRPSMPLRENERGYAARFQLEREGLWELRIVATRDTARFLATLRRDAARARAVP